MSPCAVIKDEGNSFRRIRENCEEVYNDVFVEPLKEICKDLDKDNSTFYEFMNPQREKRFIFLVGVALVVVALTTAGVTFSVYKTLSNAAEISKNRDAINNLNKRFDDLAQMSSDSVTYYRDTLKTIKDLKELLIMQNYTIVERFDNIPFAIWDISQAQAVNSMLSSLVPEFVRFWHMKKIFPQIWRYLGFDVPMRPINAIYDQYNQISPKENQHKTEKNHDKGSRGNTQS